MWMDLLEILKWIKVNNKNKIQTQFFLNKSRNNLINPQI